MESLRVYVVPRRCAGAGGECGGGTRAVDELIETMMALALEVDSVEAIWAHKTKIIVCLLPINGILTNPQNCDSESPSSSVDQKKLQAKPLKSAVEDWVGRLLAMVSSDMPDKCWVGVVLMGVTCQECSSDNFFSLYFVWFNSLLSHIKNPESSRIVRVVSCTSTSDLLTRKALSICREQFVNFPA
ncbi:hypothetical protein F2Q69_00032280 [Brassica cretica]|uniref:Pre-rRNA-processing protein RIX1 N-terminal domain-containing protein n=1 Tax=Brassica cretica TaxID=69181 RepID=A0A8S9S1H0_BRACR|nr:hypothetical protein F2Q69_00032280 [Brassica cretica]